MIEDYDFVTMDNYSKDMDELTNIYKNSVKNLKEEVDSLKKLISLIVKQSKEIRISNSAMVDYENIEIIRYTDPASMDLVLKYKEKE